MTGSSRSSDGLDPRRRRLLFRSWHRGTREADLIMGRFADVHLAAFSDAELDQYEHLLDALESDLLSWMTGVAVDVDVERLRRYAFIGERGLLFACRGSEELLESAIDQRADFVTHQDTGGRNRARDAVFFP